MRNLYVYVVLFTTLMMTIGGSVSVFMATADIISPAPYYETYESYVQWQDKSLSPEEFRSEYDTMVENEKEQSKHRATNRLIKSFGWVVIPLPIFIFFQRRMLKNENKNT